MFEQIFSNQDHSFNGYATAKHVANVAAELVVQKRIELLTQNKGHITSISWSMTDENDGDGSVFKLPSDICITMAGQKDELYLGDAASFEVLDLDDWTNVGFGLKNVNNLIEDHQNEHQGNWRASTIAVLSEITGITLELVEPYFWLVHQHVLANYQDGDGELNFDETPGSENDDD